MSSGSGVHVHDECHSKFQELKLGKKHKFIIFKLNETRDMIIVEKSSDCKDITNPEMIHEELLKCLPKDECRYAVYDFEYDSGEGRRNKIFFIAWSPDDASVRYKMVSASSKPAFLSKLQISNEIQATAYDEVDYKTVLEKAMRK